MALLSELTALRARVAASPGRLEKRRLVADYLRRLSPEDLRLAVTYLSGRAFPVSDPRVLNVRGLPAPAPGPSPSGPSPCPLPRKEEGADAGGCGGGVRRGGGGRRAGRAEGCVTRASASWPRGPPRRSAICSSA